MSNSTSLGTNHTLGLYTSPEMRAVEITALVLMIIVGTIGNLLIIGAILIQRDVRREAGNMLIINLAVADLIITSITMPTILANVVYGSNVLGEGDGCKIVSGLMTNSMGQSTYFIAAIAVNRYMGVCHNHVYKRVFKKVNTIIIILTINLSMLLVTTILPYTIKYSTSVYTSIIGTCAPYSRQSGYYAMIAIIGFVIPFTVTGICYGMIFWKIHHTPAPVTSNSNGSEDKKVRAIKTLFLIFILFISCWLPYTMSWFLDPQRKLPIRVLRFLAWLALGNSCINSFVYGMRSKQFRRGYKMVACFWRKRQEVAPSTVTPNTAKES